VREEPAEEPLKSRDGMQELDSELTGWLPCVRVIKFSYSNQTPSIHPSGTKAMHPSRAL
jgi:hypothetical protein